MTNEQKLLADSFLRLNHKRVRASKIDESLKQKISEFISKIERAHKDAENSKLIF